MGKKLIPSASVEWLALDKSGQKIADFKCLNTAVRLQTRPDGGVDLVLVGKDQSGAIIHAKCDAIAVIGSMKSCIEAHSFESVHEPVPSVRIRGQLDPLSEDRSVSITELAAVPAYVAGLNRDKWEREIDYLDGLRELFEITATACNRMLSSFGKRVLRGRTD